MLMKILLLCVQVTQRQTGEVMVLKELLHYDEEANTSFLKEVSHDQCFTTVVAVCFLKGGP